MVHLNTDFCIPFLIWLSLVYGQNSTVISSKTASTAEITESNTTKPVIYYVCGRNRNSIYGDCFCIGKSIWCNKYMWDAAAFKNANIKILKPNFKVENVKINGHNFGTLKKAETLPALAENLKSLRLSSNNITDIEDRTFDKFIALESLSLSNNNITNLSNKILTQKLGSTLLGLHLGDNPFLKISSIDFTHLTNLKLLKINGNFNVGKFIASGVWSFPKSLSNLRELSLPKCNITDIPDNVFQNLKSLTTLYLFDNPITAYPKTLNTISTLRYLDLRWTFITELNQTAMGVNENLNDLILHFYKVISIEDCAFCGFTNLTTLHLYSNPNLSFIHENAFGHAKNGITPKITSFTVEFCNLTVIPEKLLPWQNVDEVGIGGNPFNCSCEMAWLIEDIFKPNHKLNLKNVGLYHGIETPTLRCHSPLKYKNIEFFNLDQNYCKKPPQKPSKTSALVLFLIFAGFAAIVILACSYFFRFDKTKNFAKCCCKIINEKFGNNNA